MLNFCLDRFSVPLSGIGLEKEGDKVCCIALTNPSEVIIVDGSSSANGAGVMESHLWVQQP